MIVVMAPKKNLCLILSVAIHLRIMEGRRIKGVRLISRQLLEKDPSLGLLVGNKFFVLCRKRDGWTNNKQFI